MGGAPAPSAPADRHGTNRTTCSSLRPLPLSTGLRPTLLTSHPSRPTLHSPQRLSAQAPRAGTERDAQFRKGGPRALAVSVSRGPLQELQAGRACRSGAVGRAVPEHPCRLRVACWLGDRPSHAWLTLGLCLELSAQGAGRLEEAQWLGQPLGWWEQPRSQVQKLNLWRSRVSGGTVGGGGQCSSCPGPRLEWSLPLPGRVGSLP